MTKRKEWADMSPEERKKGIIGIVFIVLLIFILVWSCGGDDDSENKTEPAKAKTEEEMRKTAFYYSQSYVKSILKSPSTADFPFSDEAVVNKIGKDSFEVISYVDAQNSYGAMLRSNYVCQLRVWADGDSMQLINVRLLE